MFLNQFYQDPLHEYSDTMVHLLPPLSEILRNCSLWVDYFYRYSSVPTLIMPQLDMVRSVVYGELGL